MINTKDLQLASFFRLKGYHYTMEIDSYGQGIFIFNSMDEALEKTLSLEYGNSEHAPLEGIRRGLLKQLEILKRSDGIPYNNRRNR